MNRLHADALICATIYIRLGSRLNRPSRLRERLNVQLGFRLKGRLLRAK